MTSDEQDKQTLLCLRLQRISQIEKILPIAIMGFRKMTVDSCGYYSIEHRIELLKHEYKELTGREYLDKTELNNVGEWRE